MMGKRKRGQYFSNEGRAVSSFSDSSDPNQAPISFLSTDNRSLKNLEKSINQLRDLHGDFDDLVSEQADNIDAVQQNNEETHNQTQDATKDVKKAKHYQPCRCGIL